MKKIILACAILGFAIGCHQQEDHNSIILQDNSWHIPTVNADNAITRNVAFYPFVSYNGETITSDKLPDEIPFTYKVRHTITNDSIQINMHISSKDGYGFLDREFCVNPHKKQTLYLHGFNKCQVYLLVNNLDVNQGKKDVEMMLVFVTYDSYDEWKYNPEIKILGW